MVKGNRRKGKNTLSFSTPTSISEEEEGGVGWVIRVHFLPGLLNQPLPPLTAAALPNSDSVLALMNSAA